MAHQWRRLSAALLLGLAPAGGFGIAGCRCDDGGAGPAAGTPSASVGVLPSALAGRVLVTVGERAITLGDYAAALERMDRFERARYQSPDRRRQLLDEMVEVELLAAEARRRGLDRDPEVVSRIDQALRDLVLMDLRAGLPGPEAIPEAEVRAYYAQHRADFAVPERRRLSVIEVGTRDEAARLLDRARAATPAGWGELVRQHSLRRDPPGSGEDALLGDVGFVELPGAGPLPGGGSIESTVPEAVRRAGFAIAEQGAVHPAVVEAAGHAFLVRLITRNPPGTRTYVEAERSIRVSLAQQKIRDAEAKLERELRQRFPVEIDQAALANLPAAASAKSPVGSAAPAPSARAGEADAGDRRAIP